MEEELELAQGGHETQSVTPAARGQRHAAERTLCPSSTDWAPPQLRLQEGRVVGGSSESQRLPSRSPRQGTPWQGAPSAAPSCRAAWPGSARCSDTIALRHQASLCQGGRRHRFPEQGGQSSLRTDSHRPALFLAPLARGKVVSGRHQQAPFVEETGKIPFLP